MATIYEELGAEYAYLLRTVNLLEHTSATQPDERRRLVEVLGAHLDVKRHIEEDLLHPLLGALPETRGLAAQQRREASEVHERYAVLCNAAPAEPRFKHQIEVFSSLLRQHVASMEYDLFDQAARAVPDEEAATLGERAEAMRREARSRLPRA